MTTDSPSSATFTVSLAPTARAKCRACKLVIEKGSLRVSREVPSTFAGDKRSIVHHYHLDHGMHAATRVRCAASVAPTFVAAASLSPSQKNRAKAAGIRSLAAWRKRCLEGTR